MRPLSPPAPSRRLKEQRGLNLTRLKDLFHRCQERLVVEGKRHANLQILACAFSRVWRAGREVLLGEHSPDSMAPILVPFKTVLDKARKADQRRSGEDEINILGMLRDLLTHRRFTVGS